MINTKYGCFKVTRKGVVAISVVRVKRRVRHHHIEYNAGDLTFVEHRKIPRYLHKIIISWADHVATFDLNGNLLNLQV